MQRKDNAKAEQEFTKSLQLSPGSGQVSYWLGSVIGAIPSLPHQTATGWAVVKSWSGGGTKETELFSVSGGEWRIAWECRSVASPSAGIFQIEVKNAAGHLVSVAANQRGTGADVSYVHAPPGEYYLTVNSANVNWTVRVEVRP
jgi:hypothetical protein